MATNNPLDEGFDDAVRATFRPTQPLLSPSGKLRVANLFCGTGTLSQAAIEAGMEVVYAHDPNKRVRAFYERKIRLVPDDGELPDFSTIPAFDIVLATLPKDGIEDALSFVLRYLRVRRPDTFVLVGPIEDNEQALVTLVREKTQSLGYQVASGADTLLGIYEPSTKVEAPVVIGLYLLDPIRIPVLASDDPVQGKSASMIRTVLSQIAEAFRPPPSRNSTRRRRGLIQPW